MPENERCANCGKPIDENPNPFGQSGWRHADHTGAGVGDHADNWCETDNGYVKVTPAGTSQRLCEGRLTIPLPIDWNEWRAEWHTWKAAHKADFRTTPVRFPDKNFLADDILGTWDIKGRTVELSEVTFPNLTERDERGNLKRYQVRGIGVTFGIGADGAGTVVHSFAELEDVLGLT